MSFLKTSKNILKRIFYFFLGTLLVSGAFLIYSNNLINKNAEEKTFSKVEDIPHSKVGVILGTSKYYAKGGINLYFKYRIDAAVELFNSGKIEFILISGDNGTEYYNEPQTILEELLKEGIPEDKIFLDHAGFRTLDSMVRAKKVFGQTEFIIISQKFHNERAIYLAEKNGISAVGFNAKDVDKHRGLKTKTREYFARGKAVLDIVFKVQPKFLGDPIEIQ